MRFEVVGYLEKEEEPKTLPCEFKCEEVNQIKVHSCSKTGRLKIEFLFCVDQNEKSADVKSLTLVEIA